MPTVGRKASGKHTQSIVFSKAAGWTKARSRKWCSDHDYKTDGYDETSTGHRWRQYDPEPGKFRYRNKVIEKKNGKPSITLVQGFPKGSRPKGEETEMSMSEEIKALQETIAGLTTERDALTSQVDALTQERDALKADVERMTGEMEAAQATAKEQLEAAQAETETAKAELATAQGELTAAKDALLHPAHHDAGTDGEQEAAGEGNEASDTDSMTPNYDAFKALQKAGKAQKATQYWEDHADEIQAEMKAVAEEGKSDA